MKYNNKIIVKLANGDFNTYRFDYDSTDFQKIVFEIAKLENIQFSYIEWDKNIFTKTDNSIGIILDWNKEEMKDDLIILLDCINEVIEGIKALLEAEKGVYNQFTNKWLSRKENLEGLEATVFEEFCRWFAFEK